MLTLWIVLGIIGLLALLFLMVLLILGRPSIREPRFIKAMRFGIIAEYTVYIGYGCDAADHRSVLAG